MNWFPKNERARATATYISLQYIGLALCTPVLTFLTAHYCWQMVFYATGGVGIAFGMYWLIVYRDPMHSRKTRQAELDLIKAGGRYGSQDQTAVSAVVERADIIYLLKSKTVWGLFVAQFAYNSTLIFFMTWFIVYLEKALTSRCRKQD